MIKTTFDNIRLLGKGMLELHRLTFESIGLKDDDTYMKVCILLKEAQTIINKAIDILKIEK